MTYSTSNPPVLIAQAIGGNAAPKLWHWNNDDDLSAIDGNGYVTNGDDLGLAVGDQIVNEDLSDETLTSFRVDSVTAGGAADLADGTVIGSATDSD